MQEMPLVTCMIPCYRKFDYVYEAIQSVIEQDYPHIELLISDDASEEFPQKSIEDYIATHARKNIVYWHVSRHSENVGIVRNINSMIKNGRGEYFMVLAGDDVFYDGNVVSKVVARFISTGSDFLACSRLQCTESLEPIKFLPTEDEKRKISKLNTARKQFESFAVFRFYNMASGSAMYFSRKNIESMGLYNENYRNWEDGPRLAAYVKRGIPLPTAHDIVAVKYRCGGVSNNPEGNQFAFSHITNDRVLYTQTVTVSWPNRHWKTRRKLLFWCKWDLCDNAKQRFWLMLRYPEYGTRILLRKLRHKPIR